MEMEKINTYYFYLYLFFCGFCGIIAVIKRGYVMKHFVSFVILSLVSFGAFAANNGRPAMSNKIMSAPRYTASINQLNGASNVSASTAKIEETAAAKEEKAEIDMREAEKNACINNNIGIGNTFVWASRYSDPSNYARMVEDTTNPQNNVCFARVELKSDDESRVKVSDIAPKYFMWGESIECGSWVDQKDMEKRILDARKGARIGGIVASTVGGAGLGVGVMELIGNTSIKGWKGQKDLTDEEKVVFYKTMLKSADNKEQIVNALKTIKKYNEEHDSWSDYSKYEPYVNEFAAQ